MPARRAWQGMPLSYCVCEQSQRRHEADSGNLLTLLQMNSRKKQIRQWNVCSKHILWPWTPLYNRYALIYVAYSRDNRQPFISHTHTRDEQRFDLRQMTIWIKNWSGDGANGPLSTMPPPPSVLCPVTSSPVVLAGSITYLAIKVLEISGILQERERERERDKKSVKHKKLVHWSTFLSN